jgi:hypothetical protein
MRIKARYRLLLVVILYCILLIYCQSCRPEYEMQCVAVAYKLDKIDTTEDNDVILHYIPVRPQTGIPFTMDARMGHGFKVGMYTIYPRKR